VVVAARRGRNDCTVSICFRRRWSVNGFRAKTITPSARP
jgi:hypothetical protein